MPAGRAAVAEGVTILGAWVYYPSTSVLAGRKPAKIASMYMFALLANLRKMKRCDSVVCYRTFLIIFFTNQTEPIFFVLVYLDF